MTASLTAVLHTERLVALRALPGFAELGPETVAAVAQHVRERFFPKGSVILQEGEPIENVLLVIDGRVALSRHDHDLSSMFEHQSLGFIQALGLIPALARNNEGIHAVAATDVVAYEIPLDLLWELLEDDFDVLQATIAGLARQVLYARQRLERGAGFVRNREPEPLPEQPLDLVERVIFLRKVMVVAGSRIEALIELARAVTEVRFEAGQELWREGQAGGSMFMLVAGQVAAETAAGQSFAFDPGDFLGGIDSMAETGRWYTATAATPCVGLRLEAERMLDVLEDNPQLGLRMLESIAQGVDMLYELKAGHAPPREAA